MSKFHTPMIDDFVNELLGDERELSDAANQDQAEHSQPEQTITKVDTEAETAQTSTHVETEVEAIKEQPEKTTAEPAEQTAIHAEPEVINTETTEELIEQTPTQVETEVEAVEELPVEEISITDNLTVEEQHDQIPSPEEVEELSLKSISPAIPEPAGHTPTPAEIEASTVVEELASISLDDYAKATAVIENFKANVGNPDTTNTETTEALKEQTSTHVETEVEAAEELPIEDHSQETTPDSTNTETTEELKEQTPTHIETEVEAVEDNPSSTKEQTAQTSTPITTGVETEEDNSKSQPDPDATNTETTDEPSDQTSAHVEIEIKAAEELPIEDNSQVSSNPDPEAIAASVIADFDAEFPDENQATTKVDSVPAPSDVQPVNPTVEESTESAPDPDAIAASVIADFDEEFPSEPAVVESTVNAEPEPLPTPDPDAIAASVIADFDAEFPEDSSIVENTQSQPTLDPDDIAASVIADFEAEFPDTESDAVHPVPGPSDDHATDEKEVAVVTDQDTDVAPVTADSDTAGASLAETEHPPADAVQETVAQQEEPEPRDDFPLDLQKWLQPPEIPENEIEIVTYLRCVRFELQGQHYAAEVQTLLEVLDHADIVPIPSMRHPVLGILNLRGSIVPVIDPSPLLGLPPRTDTDSQLLVAEHNGDAVALPVSDVFEVVNIDQNDIQSAPQAGQHVLGLAPLGDEMLTLLDLKGLINAILNI